MDGHRVLRSDDPGALALKGSGWRVVAHSWAAELDLTRVDVVRLGGQVARVTDSGFTVRALSPSDLAAVLALDGATVGDYVGGIASSHHRLPPEWALARAGRLGFGVFDPPGSLVGMTFVDVSPDRLGGEVDFTVVAREQRGRGLGTALKAFAVLQLILLGARTLRTGGSSDNLASLAANVGVGFIVDESWLTLAPPLG